MAAVAVQGLVKQYGGQRVVDAVDLVAADGRLLVLVGPSGCGKTTTLRMIAGLEAPEAGEIRIGDRVVNRIAARDRDVAMVFQNYALYPHMTVRKNLAFGLRMRGVPRDQVRRRVEEVAHLLRIARLLDRLPSQLSGGQQQRVALGRAIVRNPAVFLLDEPLSNLDAQLRAAMRTELVRLHRQLGTTMIHVTHDQTEAMMMGDRIAVMRAGRIEQVGEPLEIYHRPATRFVAAFMGQWPMNFFRGQIADGVLRVQDAAWPLPRLAAGTAGAASVEVGIRPEALTSVPTGDGSPGRASTPSPVGEPAGAGTSLRLEVQIELVQPLGAECLVHARWHDLPLAATTRAAEPPAAGQRALWTVPVDQLHLFDMASGQRL